MKIHLYQAGCGDAFRIEFIGTDGKTRNIIVDSGYAKTYRDIISKDIMSIDEIDLWIISHLHEDHIAGVIEYLKPIKAGATSDKVKRWLYNFPRPAGNRAVKVSTPSTAMSISQSDKLQTYLQSVDHPSTDITTESPLITIDNLTIKVLSPRPQDLLSLRKKYALPGTLLERHESEVISRPTKASANDYSTKLCEFQIYESEFDTSLENASSISFIAETNGKRSLWLADAHADIIIQALQTLGYTELNPLGCDCVKIAHHGSNFNNSPLLFSYIKSPLYIISGDGVNVDHLPTKKTVAQLLQNPGRNIENEPYKILFTADNKIIRGMFEVDGENVFSDYNFQVSFQKLQTQILEII
jgi:beta-lactamase superfamily II metal-dependent hydrolase